MAMMMMMMMMMVRDGDGDGNGNGDGDGEDEDEDGDPDDKQCCFCSVKHTGYCCPCSVFVQSLYDDWAWTISLERNCWGRKTHGLQHDHVNRPRDDSPNNLATRFFVAANKRVIW